MELLPDFGIAIDLGKLFNAVNEELELLEYLLQHLHILVVHRLVEQIIQAEPAGNDQHEALVQLAGDVEQELVVILQLQAVILNIIDHSGLLLVEEFPDFEHILEMVSGNFVEMAFLQAELLLILFFQHLEVEVEEALDLGNILRLEAVEIVEQVVKGLQQPLVQLRPA